MAPYPIGHVSKPSSVGLGLVRLTAAACLPLRVLGWPAGVSRGLGVCLAVTRWTWLGGLGVCLSIQPLLESIVYALGMTSTDSPQVRAITYARVSTAKQERGGVSLGDQGVKLEAAAVCRGWDSDHVSEVASGKTLSGRPLLREALDRLDRGEAQALIVTKVDRVARNTVDVLNLAARADKNGWVLVILNLDLDTSTPTGRLVLTILAAVAGMESALIGERAMDTHAARRAAGVRRGRKVSIPETTRQRIALERASGLSLAAIANGLNADGVPTRNAGAKWHPSTVAKVLDSLRVDAEMVSIREALEVAA